jgi:hypothetical protein
VLGTTTFTIPVAGTATGAATGTVQSLAPGATFPIPSDGDDDAAVTVNVAFQTLADRTALLAVNTGVFKLAGRIVLYNSFGPAHDAAHITAASLTAGTWNQLLCVNALLVLGAEEGALSVASPGVPGSNAVWAVSGIAATDVVEVSLETTAGSANGYLGLFYAVVAPGAAAPSFPGGYALAPMSTRSLTGSTNVRSTAHLPHVGTGTLYIVPAFYALASATYTVALTDGLVFKVDALRITGMPQ